MRKYRNIVWGGCLLLTLLAPTFASAQSVVNPKRVTFSPSPDDAVVTRYEIGYFLIGASEPFFTSDLNRPVCTPTCDLPLPAKPAFGNFTAKVRAFGVDQAGQPIASAWSEDSNPFDLLPVPPARPTVVR